MTLAAVNELRDRTYNSRNGHLAQERSLSSMLVHPSGMQHENTTMFWVMMPSVTSRWVTVTKSDTPII
jgi:hypothetical protein